MAIKNNYPPQEKTHERQGNGGNWSGDNEAVSGEKHGQKKAQFVRAEQRAGLITNPGLENSPGRASADTSGE